MKYLIVNSPNWECFKQKTDALAADGHNFTIGFIEHVGDATGDFPGGWGCLRFANALPAASLFTSPDAEYRYSEATKEWRCNGSAAINQNQLRSLYDYFVSLEGRQP